MSTKILSSSTPNVYFVAGSALRRHAVSTNGSSGTAALLRPVSSPAPQPSSPAHCNYSHRMYSNGGTSRRNVPKFAVRSTKLANESTNSTVVGNGGASAVVSSGGTSSPPRIDTSKPLTTNNLFSVTNYIANLFANKFGRKRRDHELLREGDLVVGESKRGTYPSNTSGSLPYMNPDLDSYQLLKTPMTDMIQNKLVLKNRKEFMEAWAKRVVQRVDDGKAESHPLYKYILNDTHRKELEKLDTMQMTQLLDKRAIQERNFFLNTLGFYEKDRNEINAQTELIFDHMLEHVAKFSETNIYDKANLPNPGDYWVESELNVLNLHLWLVYRRLSFCYDGKDMMSVLNKFYWRFVTMTLEQDVGVPGAQINKSLKKIQDHAYAMWFSLDEILQVDSPAQDVLLAEVVMRYMYPIVEDVRLRDLYFWVRYIRFTMTHLDMVETPLFVRGGWRFEMPDSALVSRVDVLFESGAAKHEISMKPKPKTVLV